MARTARKTATNTATNTAPAEARADIYQRVTDRIVAAIEAGAGDWKRPWHSAAATGLPVNVASGKPYRGINTLALWITAQAEGYGSNVWGTYNQWAERGAQVRKGERSTHIVFWKMMERGEQDGEGDNDNKRSPMMARAYCVFNAAQVEGYEAPAVPVPQPLAAERLAHADDFFAALGMKVAHGGSRAFYRPATDSVQMPVFEAFHSREAYYAVLAHEATHWTGHADRCNRNLKNRFGDNGYAAEELIAELGAAFLCADLDLAAEPREDHAEYVGHWLAVMKADKRAIFTAASHAQKAADFMHAAQPDAAADDDHGEDEQALAA